jgi:hypothetical protein
LLHDCIDVAGLADYANGNPLPVAEEFQIHGGIVNGQVANVEPVEFQRESRIGQRNFVIQTVYTQTKTSLE